MYTCLISAQCELLSLVFFIVYKPEESSRTAVKTHHNGGPKISWLIVLCYGYSVYDIL